MKLEHLYNYINKEKSRSYLHRNNSGDIYCDDKNLQEKLRIIMRCGNIVELYHGVSNSITYEWKKIDKKDWESFLLWWNMVND